MKKKIGDLTDEEIMDYLGENKCSYCNYETVYYPDGSEYECPKTVKCYGGDPIFPICTENKDVEKEIVENYRDNNLDQEVEVEEDD